MRQPSDMELRVAAAERVLADWIGRPFAWGTSDCAHLAAATLIARGRETQLGAAERYRSFAGSRRALKRLGFSNIEAALDAHDLQRIPPAAALPCDLVALPGEGGMPALTVALGNGRVLGFLDGEVRVLQPLAYASAWRT